MTTPMTSSVIESFDCDSDPSNLGPRWDEWIDMINQYFVGHGITDNVRKINLLFFYGGRSLYKTHQTLTETTIPDKVDNNDYSKAVFRLTTYFNPKRNRVVEDFQEYETKLK